MKYNKFSLLLAGLLIMVPADLFSVNLKKLYNQFSEKIAAGDKAGAIQIFDNEVLPALAGRDPQAREEQIQKFIKHFYPGSPLETRTSTLQDIATYLDNGQARAIAAAPQGAGPGPAAIIAQMQKQIADLQAELADTQADHVSTMQVAQGDANQTKLTNQQLAQQLTQLQQQLAQEQAATTDLRKAIAKGAESSAAMKSLQKQLDRLDQTNKTLQETLEALQAEKDAAQAEAHEQANTNAQLKTHLTGVKLSQDLKLEDQAKQYNQQIAELQDKIKNIYSLKDEVTQAKGVIQKTLNDTTKELEAIKKLNQENETAKTRLEDQVQKLTEENKELAKQHDQATQKASSNHGTSLQEATTKLAELQQDLKDAQAAQVKAQEDFKVKSASTESLTKTQQQQLAQLQQELETAQKLATQKSASTESLTQAQQKIDALEKELEEAQAAQKQAQKVADQEMTEQEQLRKKVKGLQDNISQLEKDSENVKTSQEAAEKSAKKLQSLQEELAKEKAISEKQKSTIEADKRDLEEQLQEIENLTKQQKENTNAKQKLDDTKKDLKEAEDKLKEAENNVQKAAQGGVALLKQINELTAANKDYQAQLSAMRRLQKSLPKGVTLEEFIKHAEESAAAAPSTIGRLIQTPKVPKDQRPVGTSNTNFEAVD